MQVKLLEHTPNPQHVIATAARQCYNPGFVGYDYEYWEDDDDDDDDDKYIKKIIALGHTSVLEHASFTFAIEGISRACSHQLVRFRVASFSQQSQRYCFMGEAFPYEIPPSIEDSTVKLEYEKMMMAIGNFYNYMVEKGIPKEDARYVLPNACHTNIVMTMNARELLHAFRLRCCNRAQWEIRRLFEEILIIVRNIAPVVFEKAGPDCITKGVCSEGALSCKK